MRKVDEIVVNDGSIDRTSQISHKCGLKWLSSENVGKGRAMKIGVKSARGYSTLS